MITVYPAKPGKYGYGGWIDCDCVYQNGLQIFGTCDATCYVPQKYLTGSVEPNYPMPAIRAAWNEDHCLGAWSLDYATLEVF